MGHQVAAALIAHGFDEPIPATLAVGRGAILLVRGWIAPPRGTRLSPFVVELDGETQRFDARGEVRFDVPKVDGRPPRGFFVPIAIAASRAGTFARLRITSGDFVLVEQRIEFLPPERRTIAIDTPNVALAPSRLFAGVPSSVTRMVSRSR